MKDLKKSTTTISENARRALDITRDEYAFCSYIHYRCADSRQKVRGMCCDTKDDIAAFVGVSRRGLYKFIDRMEAKGLIVADAATGFLHTTENWVIVENDENKVHKNEKKQREQSSQNVRTKFTESVNKVPRNIEVKEEKKEKGESGEQRLATLDTPPTPSKKSEPLEEETLSSKNIQAAAAQNRQVADAAAAAAEVSKWAQVEQQTVISWYELARRKFTLNDFELLTIKFCGFYANHSDTGKRQRFLFDPVLFFRNQFVSWLSTENRLAPNNHPAPAATSAIHSKTPRY